VRLRHGERFLCRCALERAHAWIPAQSTKGGRAIGFALSADAVTVLKGITRAEEHERVFLYEGRPVTNAYGKAAWRKTCKRAGLAGLRFHDLRHYPECQTMPCPAYLGRYSLHLPEPDSA
jgi:integrase